MCIFEVFEVVKKEERWSERASYVLVDNLLVKQEKQPFVFRSAVRNFTKNWKVIVCNSEHMLCKELLIHLPVGLLFRQENNRKQEF